MHLNNLILLGDILPRNVFSTFFRELLAGITAILYSVLGLFFEIIFAVANLDNTEMMNGIYADVEQKFYVIVGIFMLFKVMMSLITYFANPDKIADKEMGAGKMVTRIIVMLVLLIIVPNYVFKTLSNIQIPLLNTLGSVVMNSQVALDQTKAHSVGQQMATKILGGFFTPSKVEGCGGVIITDGIIDSITTMASAPCENDKSIYKYDFNFVGALFSIIVILIFVIIIGIQVAIRAFKLMILKILAPVPIISYIDPKSMKDGGRTSAYIKLFISTYLDLFIQFGIMFFVLLLINKLINGPFGLFNLSNIQGAVTIISDTKVFGMVFVIIGLLLFAFQAPKFIKKALGLKDSEFGAGLSGFLTTGAVMAGAVGSGVAGFAASKAAGKGMLMNIGSGISSAISGGRAGYSAAGDKGDFSKVLPAINKKNAEMAANRAANSTALGRVGTALSGVFLGETEADKDAAKLKALKSKSTTAKQLKEYLIGEGKKKAANIRHDMDVNGTTQNISLDDLNAALDYATSGDGDGMVHFADGSAYAVNSSVINKLKGDLEEIGGSTYAKMVDERVANGGEHDIALDSYRQVYAESLGTTVTALSQPIIVNGVQQDFNALQNVSEIKTTQKKSETEAFKMENSAEFAKHKADAKANSKK